MEANQVNKIIEEELKDRDSFDWPETWSERIEELIIEPFAGNFFNPESQIYEEYWVVANLEPGSLTDGFLIIYDAETDLFGLANKGDLFDDGSGVLIGFYGTLAKALENTQD